MEKKTSSEANPTPAIRHLWVAITRNTQCLGSGSSSACRTLPPTVLEFSREIEPTGDYIERKTDGMEVVTWLRRLTSPMTSHLQAGDLGELFMLLRNLWAWNQWHGLQSDSEDLSTRSTERRRRWMFQLKQSGRERERARENTPTLPASTILFSSGPRWTGWCPPILRTIPITQSTGSNANLFWKHPHRHIQK